MFTGILLPNFTVSDDISFYEAKVWAYDIHRLAQRISFLNPDDKAMENQVYIRDQGVKFDVIPLGRTTVGRSLNQYLVLNAEGRLMEYNNS